MRRRAPRRQSRRLVMRTIISLVSDGKAVLTGRLRAEQRLSGDCSEPIGQTVAGGRYDRPYLDTIVRCRKCENCLRYRRRVWSARARHEIGMSYRTWMVTLTLSPEQHSRTMYRLHSDLSSRRVPTGEISADDIFRLRAGEFGKEVTKWLKRLRAAGGHLRYLSVVEAHKSGLPHVHLLVHETSPSLTYRALVGGWKLGFAHAKLVEGPEAALYVTKYLAKSMLARVRASTQYGQQQPSLTKVANSAT